MSLLGYTVLLLFWIYCAAERACEEPPPRRVKEVPTETWDKPPYPHGTQATYRCRPGYIKLGRIVFQCVDGVWEQSFPWTECRNKPCGHPGDIQFGSFELTSGKEFVFGARVEYRCDVGYQMLSLRNYRECQADGWSNDVPHCEVAKCLPVKAPENGQIIMTGVFELDQEFSFGQVVKFECNANYKLVGAKEAHCSSNGRWSSDVPQCQEITCDVPEILHGYVHSPKASYKESERLQFSCDKGYRYGERAEAQCSGSGWTPTPYCTEIVCSPPRIRNGNSEPQKDIYKEGAVITVRCNSGYYFKAVGGQNTAECTKNGWVPAPECVEKPCDYPVIENGVLSRSLEYYKNYYFPMGIEQQADYRCDNGYSTPSGENWVRIVCSARGWFPEPKCLKICQVRQLENGYFLYRRRTVYKEGEKIRYACSDNYNPENEGGEVTCTKNDWSPSPRCIRKKICQRVEFDNGYFTTGKAAFGLQEKTTYGCHIGYVTAEGQQTGQIQCQENGWTPPPKCIKPCKIPRYEVLNYHTNKIVFLPGDTLEYACSDGYQTTNNMTTGSARCDINGEWIPEPQCLAIECEMLIIPNGDVYPKEGKYHNGDVVRFACAKNYVRVGPTSAQCYYFGWFPSPPICKVDPRDCAPPAEITNGNIIGDIVEQYRHGDRTEYECNNKFKMIGSREIECIDGQWSSPPSCIEDKMPCGSPSSIPNVVVLQQNQAQFSHGDEINYRCKQGTGSYGKKKTKCLNGEWKPLPFCGDSSHKCVSPVDIEIVNTERVPRPNKETAAHKVIYYICKSNGSNIKKATCMFGKWSPEIECIAENSCPPPPQLPGAQQIAVKRNYKSGSKITFSCLKNFQLDGVNEITCIHGKWQSPPRCIERPCLPPQPLECAEVPRLENQNLRVEKEGKTTYLAGAKFKYVSRSGFLLDGNSEITCSMGNWTSTPTCTEMPCGSIPKVANSQIEGRNKTMYEPGETVRYQCDPGFLTAGPPEIICRAGNWTTPPSCEDASCGAPPEVPRASTASSQHERYLPGARVQYECETNFQIMGVNYVTCTNGQWSQAPTCRDVTCEPPPEIAGGKVQGVKKSRYLPGEEAQYRCWQGFQMTGDSTVACQNGTWTELPKCRGRGEKCGPPPAIENGDLLSFPLQEYAPGSTVEYKCQSLYVLEGSQYITCTEGQWTTPPVCLVACTASEEDMNRNNIGLKWTRRNKLYSTSGDFIEFQCKIGYVQDPASSPFRVQCVEGKLEYPHCKPGKKCTVLERDMAKNNIQLQSSLSSTSSYLSSEHIYFECRSWWHHKISSPEEFRVQCLDGVFKYPRCGLWG
ncbi:complement factor H isoform X2 [Dromaius novaehollandiae]|uniref:complement factor H isoform X2 n=1 Tax=Dromaius novaehollandiae TaxID=8790 RepID=UPI00311E0533